MQDPLKKPGKEPILRSVLLQAMSDTPGHCAAIPDCNKTGCGIVFFFSPGNFSCSYEQAVVSQCTSLHSKKKKPLCTSHCSRYSCYLYRYKRECAVHTSLSVRYVSTR